MVEIRVLRRQRRARWSPLPVGGWILLAALIVAWQIIRMAVCAVLVLFEPVLQAILVADPRFPRWGMLAFSVGSLMLYWFYLGLMSLFIPLPPGHDHRH